MVPSTIDFAHYLSILDLNTKDQTPDLATLALLQQSHLKHIPFQNLDYFRYKEKWINFSDTTTLIAPVLQQRGGICFQLNYSFFSLLKQLGYNCNLVACRMHLSEFDHMALVVELEQKRYLLDVGFGENFLRHPLLLGKTVMYKCTSEIYMLQEEQERYTLYKAYGKRWRKKYSFILQPRSLYEFERTYQSHLNNPKSGFVNNQIFSLATDRGFVRFYNRRSRVYGQVVFDEFQKIKRRFAEMQPFHEGLSLMGSSTSDEEMECPRCKQSDKTEIKIELTGKILYCHRCMEAWTIED